MPTGKYWTVLVGLLASLSLASLSKTEMPEESEDEEEMDPGEKAVCVELGVGGPALPPDDAGTGMLTAILSARRG